MEWFRRLYARRIVNVNVNVVVAGVLALGPTVAAVSLTRFFVDDDNHLLINAITFVADVIADVLIYFLLHWLANHSTNRRVKDVEGAYAHMSFIRDASIVQLQRAVLSPLLYFIALGLQNMLMKKGLPREAATAIGLVTGIFTTRVLHTIWMVYEERHMRRKQALAAQVKAAGEAANPSVGDAPAGSSAGPSAGQGRAKAPVTAGEGRGG